MKRWYYPLLALAVGAIIYYQTQPAPEDTKLEAPVASSPTPSAALTSAAPATAPTPPSGRADDKLAPALLKKNERVIYGELPPGVSSVDELVFVNTPSKAWPQRLRQHLVRTGGKKLKDLKIEPQESYIILDGVGARNVERVVITVEGKNGESNRFFAEVDSESGHVTKSWGGTIHENRHSD